MHIPSFKLISQSTLKKNPKNLDGRTDGRTDGQTDGHCHSIIRPFFKRAYKNVCISFWLRILRISEVGWGTPLVKSYRLWSYMCTIILMAQCKTAPVLAHCSYCSLAQSHWHINLNTSRLPVSTWIGQLLICRKHIHFGLAANTKVLPMLYNRYCLCMVLGWS